MARKGLVVRTILVLASAAALAAVVTTSAGARNTANSITGAGSTFVAPLVSKWTTPNGGPAKKATGVTVSYSGVGSGSGVAAINGGTVDFGASDAPLSQFGGECGSCTQIPWAAGGTAVMYNLPGLPFLHLSPSVIANIYLGNITNWNDPAIKALNKAKHLPNQSIEVVHRSDGSGTTYNFTDFLSQTNNTWQSQVGKGITVNWPVGVGKSGSGGVATEVANNVGAIGYADVYYARSHGLQYAAVKNEAGRFISPTLASIKAAVNTDTSPNNNGAISIVDPDNTHPNAYPICTYTYVIWQNHNPNAGALRNFLNYAVSDKAQKLGAALLYVPLSNSVQSYDTNQISNISN